MEIKIGNIQFISFSDGICDVYEDGNNKKYTNLGFTKRILGHKRYWGAAANQMEINKVIKVPLLDNINTYDKVKIGDKSFIIELIQEKYDTNPLSMDLTLREDRIF